ncbi:MAG: accessory gene regulator B family protein [Bacillota bacterium]
MSYLSFSKRWAGYLATKTGLASEKEQILTYVIEVLFLNLANVILTLLLGLMLGVLPGTAACLLTVAIFRHTAGGAHSSSPLRCAMVTVMVFPCLALLASALAQVGQFYSDLLSGLAVFIGLMAIVLLAPVDSPAAPIISPLRRRRLKFLSILAIILVAALIAALRYSSLDYTAEIQLCLALSLLWVGFILSRPGHLLMMFIDTIDIPTKRR